MVIGIYSDAAQFGGHEKMTMALAGLILRETETDVVFIVNDRNERLVRAAEAIKAAWGARVDILLVPIQSGTKATLRFLASGRKTMRIGRELKRRRIDHLIVSQGSIEQGLAGLFAGWIYCKRVASYLPYCHKLAQTTRKMPLTRDFINSFIYKIPGCFITISQSIADDLSKMTGSRSEVVVIRNVTDPSFSKRDHTVEAAKQILRFDTRSRLILLIGRIYFPQKNQLWALGLLEYMQEDDILVIVGDGPDYGRLKEQIDRAAYGRRVRLMEWMDDPKLMMEAADVVFIPSRYEGVPMVLLEAIQLGKHILTSDLPVFREFLPTENLCRFDYRDAAVKLRRLLERPADEQVRYAQTDLEARAENSLNIKVFVRRFTLVKEDVKDAV